MSENAKAKPKKEEKKINTYYDITGDKISHRLRKCPRCGSFMANHKGVQQRWACGKCGYTEFVSVKPR
jgi:small subunit ribosomal protein S27Ae